MPKVIQSAAAALLIAGLISTADAEDAKRHQMPVPDFAAERSVAHGDVLSVTYPSSAFGTERRMHVYTPPGYAAEGRSYPVLYLIHGGGGDDTTWTKGGRANFILDNLLAERKASPMIVVMPNGGNEGGREMERRPADVSRDLSSVALSAAALRDHFIDDMRSVIIPYVEANYRVVADRQSRAIAGFSFGGAEALWAATGHPEDFAWVGVFSMGIQGSSNASPNGIAGSGSSANPSEFVAAHEAFFADAGKTNADFRLLWIGSGLEDTVVANGPVQLSQTLIDKGVAHEFHATTGGHDFANWQDYLRQFASKLFR